MGETPEAAPEGWKAKARRLAEKGKEALGKGKERGKEALEDAKELRVLKKSILTLDRVQRYLDANKKKFDNLGISKAKEDPAAVSAVIQEVNGKLQEAMDAVNQLQKTKLRFNPEFAKRIMEQFENGLNDLTDLADNLSGGITGKYVDWTVDDAKEPALRQLRLDLQGLKAKTGSLKGGFRSLEDPSIKDAPSNNRLLNPVLRGWSGYRTLKRILDALDTITTLGGVLDDEK